MQSLSTAHYSTLHHIWRIFSLFGLEVLNQKIVDEIGHAAKSYNKRRRGPKILSILMVSISSLSELSFIISLCYMDRPPWHNSCIFTWKDLKGGSNMNIALRQETENVTEPRQRDFGMESLRQCLYLLETSLDRYESLKKSGTPDIILYTEKGLINRQLLFLSKVCAELTK